MTNSDFKTQTTTTVNDSCESVHAELNPAMVERLDEIYDLADAVLTALCPEYEHDMSLCGEVVDTAESVLKEAHFGACYPYMTDECRCDDDLNADGELLCGCKTCPFSDSNKQITVETFVNQHRNQNISIMSPGGYVDIAPDTDLANMTANVGVSGSETSISWDEIKHQLVADGGTFNEDTNTWCVISYEEA